MCPDCEGSGEVLTDTATLMCPSCEGCGSVAFSANDYVPYDRTRKMVGIKSVKWTKVENLKRESYYEGL